VHALADVSLSVDEGPMVAVKGPSRSGKSTLLTIARTLESPTAGPTSECIEEAAAQAHATLALAATTAMGSDVASGVEADVRRQAAGTMAL
jgi:ABC-type lipoprotein export system ATPase subunit